MNTTAHPAAYLRRSYVDPDSPGDISHLVQVAAVRRLAKADGHNGDLVEYDDWGVSADVAKSAKRTAYARLLADMEAGSVAAVYAFDVDRLYRDPRDLIRLQDAAQRHQVRIVTTAGALAIGDGDDPAAEGFAFMGAVFGRMELQKIKKRNRAARDARIARGDHMGRPPYGYQHGRDGDGRVIFVPDPSHPLEPVFAAFKESGSFSGAARLLNEWKVPSQRGERWSGNAVNRTIRREAPGMVPRRRTEARVAPRGSHTFSRLLRCSCGKFLTPKVTFTKSKYGSYGPYVGYQCHNGRYDASHPRPYMVHESLILEWAKAEAARFVAPGERVQGTSDEKRRAELERQREDVAWSVVNLGLGREAAKAKVAEIDAELEGLNRAAEAVDLPQAIDWERWSGTDINAVLRAMWEYVELDASMRPVQAVWRVPEWRAS